jgi:hypothetical protein
MHFFLRRATFTLLLIPSTALLLDAQRMFVTEDISPDDPENYIANPATGNNAAGRIKALVVDPNNSTIVYAAAEFAGVWKSTTGATWVGSGGNGHSTAGAMKWFQASNGLRSGLTIGVTSLAIDKSVTVKGNSQRLLYATGDDDGRPNEPFGGLWVSVDAAENWRHVTLCPGGPTNIASVTFSNGRPYVSTACGIFTTASADANADLSPDPAPTTPSGGWTPLTTSGTPPPSGSIIVDGGSGTLFACSGTQVYQASASGNWTVASTPLAGNCNHLAAAPNGSATSTTALVILQPSNEQGNYEVSTVTFFGSAPAVVKNLNYHLRPYQVNPAKTGGSQNPGGSGLPVVAAVATGNSSSAPGPGVTYDVYAADNCAWYAYNPGPPASWTMLAYLPNPPADPPNLECGNVTSIHVDPWAMAFPSWYNTAQGLCGAYATTDGGVFFSGYQQSGSIVGGCINNWIPVQHRLHVLYSDAIYGITAGSNPFTPSGATYALYLPTQDNDTFMTTFGWSSWQSLSDGLGDSNQAFVDPAFPNQVLASRNKHYSAGDPAFDSSAPLVPPLPAPQEMDWGNNIAGTADLAQVMTIGAGTKPPPPPPAFADYLAVLNQDQSCATGQDHIWRNKSIPSSAGGWEKNIDVGFFPSCTIGKIQAAGGHDDGALTVYVLTGISGSHNNGLSYGSSRYPAGLGPGQVYSGLVSTGKTKGKITQWELASGTSKEPLGVADDLFVNPYDPTELYAVSVANQAIEVSRDSGAHWKTDATLTDIATNHGEYSIGDIPSAGTGGCNITRGGGATNPFSQGCSLSGMAFDAFKPEIRVAAMFYGGIAFSRDRGHDWIALDVTDNNHLACWPSPPCFLVGNNLTQIVASVFFDGETHGTKKPKKKLPIPGPDQIIYAGLRGQSMRMVIGPFRDLMSMNFTYKPKGTPAQVSVKILTKGLQQFIPLRLGTDKLFHGSLLFDWKTTASVQYQYLGDGAPTAPETRPLSSSEETDGVANVSN